MHDQVWKKCGTAVPEGRFGCRHSLEVAGTFWEKKKMLKAKIDWILEQIPKKFRLRRAEYLVT